MTQAETKNSKTEIEIGFKLNFNLHSIIMLVGPDGSGKTKFAIEQLVPQLKMAQAGRKKISIAYIGIDQILAELLDNPSFSKNSIETNQVMGQAQNILFNKIRNFSSYPVNFDFIIVDSTGLDSEFRTEILKIGEENHYGVSPLIFNYTDKSQYYRIEQSTGEKKHPDGAQMKDLRRVLSGGLLKKDYFSVEYITSRDFDSLEISVSDYADYEQYMLPEDREYIIVGDIHGCAEEFVDLLKVNGFIVGEDLKVTHPENKAVVLVGDIIDKGRGIKEAIELVYVNRDIFFMAIGNHENFVYKALKGIIKKGDRPSKEVIDEYFNTYHMLKESVKPVEPKQPVEPAEAKQMERYVKLLSEYTEDKKEYDELLMEYEAFVLLTDEQKAERKELREKFYAIFESMKHFFIHRDFIVTHAPCENKYLGKISSDALRATRDFRYPKQRDYESFAEFQYAFDEHVKFVRDEAADNHPAHIFGHVMTKDMGVCKNKINIDTGCVAGGQLTCIQVERKHAIKIIQKSVSANPNNTQKELYNFFY